jgi:hypothetical protein
MFTKYHNLNVKCTYPFDNHPLGYCWSFALHIDKEDGFSDLEKICSGCELYVHDNKEADKQPVTGAGVN